MDERGLASQVEKYIKADVTNLHMIPDDYYDTMKKSLVKRKDYYEFMTKYIKNMRSMIGQKPLLICGASIIVIRDGHILLQKRKDNGCWGYHGGCLELGERLEDAAKRELYEETGLKVNSMKLYGVFSGPELHYVYPNGDEVYIVDTVYICDDFEGELSADISEVSELRWFPFTEVPENLSPPIKGILREFIDKSLSKAFSKGFTD